MEYVLSSQVSPHETLLDILAIVYFLSEKYVIHDSTFFSNMHCFSTYEKVTNICLAIEENGLWLLRVGWTIFHLCTVSFNVFMPLFTLSCDQYNLVCF